ncbi:MAG: transketolase [Bacteroidetes bacterium]|nr:transketolase [Bacteroidota bacterium]
MKSSYTLAEMQQVCAQVRRDIVRMVYEAQSGHPGGSLGCVEYFIALYYDLLQHDPDQFTMEGKGQDLFFLSNGHISPVWYSVLARRGYFPVEELATFRRLNTRLQGHPTTHDGLPGIRVATGSLGQGFSVAIGAALGKKLNHDRQLVYVLLGDGECQEGQIWEAAMFAAHKQVDNLVATVDLNYKQIDGDTRDVLNTHSLADKFRAFGWDVIEQLHGNDLQEVMETLRAARSRTGNGKPIIIMLHTAMGKGVDFMEGTHDWHGKAPNAEQFARAMEQLPQTLADY